jgi:Flp pilus assembly protein TadG
MSMLMSGFLKNTSGNVAIMLSLAAVPILLAAGAGIDILRQNDTQTLLQAATDSAAIAGAGFAQTDIGKAKTAVENYLAQNDAYSAIASSTVVETAIDKTSGDFHVRLTGKINTTFMALVGIATLDVGAYSEVSAGGQDLEVALVLDNTASMNSEGRLISLKAASKSLVDTVFKAKPPTGYLKVGIIPFADYVNVGISNRNASWMNVPKDYSEVIKNYASVTYTGASGCHDEKGVWNNDGVPTPYTYQVCSNPGTPTTTYSDVTLDHKWYGCVGSRNSPMDLNIGSPSDKYPGLLDTGCPQEITLLTDSQTTVNTNIDAMSAVGETYIPSGLLWGWNMLDPNDPLKGAKTKAEMASTKGMKSIVLMTDGDNTKSPVYPYHYGSDAAEADKISAQLCASIKADGITIYTVAFKVTKQSSKDLLTSCATSPMQAFDATDSASLMAAFNEIGESLAQLRFTK